jgi:hypothetical protein
MTEVVGVIIGYFSMKSARGHIHPSEGAVVGMHTVRSSDDEMQAWRD